jgi:Sigma-70 factor, region 1.1
MMSRDAKYRRLLELGKQQGRLTAEDLRQALPIDQMSIDEISRVLVRLEDAGVSVEIDPALLSPGHRNSGPGDPVRLPKHTEAVVQRPVLPVEPHSTPPGSHSLGAPSPIILAHRGYPRDKLVWAAVAGALVALLLLAFFLMLYGH